MLAAWKYYIKKLPVFVTIKEMKKSFLAIRRGLTVKD
jgi:hypothetical protein